MRYSAFCLIVGTCWLIGCAGKPEVQTSQPTPYRHPLKSPGQQFGGLPPVVQNTVRAEVGAEPIYDIWKDELSTPVVYTVFFENYFLEPLIIASDGSVLNPDRTLAVGAADEGIGTLSGGAAAGLKPSDLPPNVMKVIQERAPRNEIEFINRYVVDDREIYTVTFKNPALNEEMHIAEDGTVLNQSPPPK